MALILAAQLGGTGLSQILRRRFAKLKPGDDRTRFAQAYALTSGICGLSWGLAGALWYVPGEPELQVLLMVLMIGGVTGSLVSRSPYLPALRAFVFAAGLPFVAMLAVIGTVPNLLIVSLALIFGAGILGWGRGLNRMYMREAESRLTKVDLIQELEIARNEAEERAVEADSARQAAEAGARTKTQFLSTMSHEVRTPLNGILGMTDLLADSELSADQRSCLTVIRESSNNLRLILEDILDLARLDAGVATTANNEFAPDKIALQVAAIMEPEIRRKNLELDVIVLPGVPSRVLGDEQRCRQALLNITGNAVKFTEEGKVAIRVAMEKDARAGSADVLRFAVRDTGIGIQPSTMDHLFDDFFQADQTSTRRHGGGGLGLALVKRIVTQMGGEVGVRSTVGEGSEFWFDMPLDAKPASRVEHTASTAAGTGAIRQITQLEDALGEAKTRDIVESSMDAIWHLIQTIETQRQAANAAAVARAAHDLKSTAGNIGLDDLQYLADRIENAMRDGDETAVLRHAGVARDIFVAAGRQVVEIYPQLEETLRAS